MLNSGYVESYLKLLEPQKFEALQKLMERQNVFNSLDVTESRLEKKANFPYILLKIETDDVFAAQMVGLLLDVSELLPERLEKYYLPVVVMASNTSTAISELINEENSIEHELIHIQDVLYLLENDVSYFDRVTKYSLHKSEDLDYLCSSIDLETFKIFYLEPRALANDFTNGESKIRTLFFGKIAEYECQSEREYIEIQISNYLNFLAEDFKKKFLNYETLIEKYIEDSILKYGTDIYGEKPLKKLKEVKESYSQKTLAIILSKIIR